jgi:hypothetical protein
LPSAADRRGAVVGPGKKTAEAIRQEVAREVDHLVCVLFNGRRKTGRLDLEAVETAVRAAMHHAGSAALTELLQLAAPTTEEERAIACDCGQFARYRELRSKSVRTVVGPVQVCRPYYLCPDCQQGQFPADVELEIENTEFSPGVFKLPRLDAGTRSIELRASELSMILDGIDMSKLKRVPRYERAAGTNKNSLQRVSA